MKNPLPILLAVAVLLFYLQEALGEQICPVGDSTVWTNCYAAATDANGFTYVGEWNRGIPHGKGTGTAPDGTKYIGQFEAGKRHGKGTETYPNGNEYVGIFKNGKISVIT